MHIKKITCKTALSPSRLPGLDYTLNPYRGCAHQCIYCYAPHILHIPQEKWHTMVSIKTNIPLILAQELKRKKPGMVGISTVTDPYQPLEQHYHLTRYCLEQLLIHDYPISIQTKSAAILNDHQLITRFTNPEILISIGTNNDSHRKFLEPYSSSLPQRLETLNRFADTGIKTSVFLGPLYPTLTKKDITTLIQQLADYKVHEIMVDQFHLKPGALDTISKKLFVYPKFKQSFITSLTEKKYHIPLIDHIRACCKNNNIPFKLAFPPKKKSTLKPSKNSLLMKCIIS